MQKLRHMKSSLKIIVSIAYVIVFVTGKANASQCDRYERYTSSYLASLASSEYFRQGEFDSLEHAYMAQKCVIYTMTSDMESDIRGYKAGLTTESSRRRFKSHEPVIGVLLKRHIKSQRSLNNNKRYLFEIEFAFKLKRDLSSLYEVSLPLAKIIDSVAPTLEVADFNFEAINELNVNDIIAANVGASHIRVGKFIDFEKVDMSTIEVNAILAGEHSKRNYSVPSEYIENIKWLIKKAYTEGYPLEKNMILMAGSIAKPTILTTGSYHIDFGVLGEHSLLVH